MICPRTVVVVASFALLAACDPPLQTGEGEGEGESAGEGEGEGEGTGGEGEGEGEGDDCGGALNDRSFLGFCQDRVDDNCTVDVPDPNCEVNDDSASVQRHHLCRTGDEPCPTTQPGNEAPAWDCTGTPPVGVLAFAHHLNEADPEMREFCVMVYAGAVAGESYVAFSVRNGPDFRGPDNVADDDGVLRSDVCSADYGVRKHLFFSNLDQGECAGPRYIHAYGFENCGDHPCAGDEATLGFEFPVDEQPLSNGCRKMVKMVPSLSGDNTASNGTPLDGDGTLSSRASTLVQFFAGSDAERQRKLEILETAEIACVGIDDPTGAPYRSNEIFGPQASAILQIVPR